MKKLPLSYKIQLITGLFALACIPMILIAESTTWMKDEWFHLPQWIAILVCFISGLVTLIRKGKSIGCFHGVISSLMGGMAGMALILFAILIGLLIGPDIKNSIKYRKFDKQNWNQAEESVARVYMADDLVDSKKLIGLTREEVITLLGEPFEMYPDQKDAFPAGAYNSDIYYLLGPARGFLAIDSEWLMMTFGEDGKVNRCWQYTD